MNTGRVTRSAAAASKAQTAVISPRKRTKPSTPPPLRRSDTGIRSQSGESSSSTSTEGARVAAKVVRHDRLFYLQLDKIDYYTLLNVARSASRVEITNSVNKLSRNYKKHNDYEEGGNSLEAIHKTIGEAAHVLTNSLKRQIYNSILDEKLKLHNYFVESVRPLQKTVTEIYNGVLRLRNDAEEFFEMDIKQMLEQRVYETIARNTKNKHYRSTKTNRLRIEWDVNRAGIDESYLEEYFKNDGLVGLVMCSVRYGCAVIELMTHGGVKSIIERENKRKVFTVRDYTEAEFGLDHTNYSPQIDKLNLIQNDIDEAEQAIRAELDYLKSVPDYEVDVEKAEQQLNYYKNQLRMEQISGGTNIEMEDVEFVGDDDDDDDDQLMADEE
ncbi:agip129 [Agrotis ipsilon multiple nucleopolyhedrovirus]|uniref:Baculovirus J domain protein n=1 Tax=Agrotis ipsilon multiple nucleopolyhedrovirus TaxID=208013 RepID=B6D643_9ABAC|nr:agip129 [Agrotis ipsilon multiple nucleopolyhedrovirus]ACI28830.1 baculovirus J domain protein [Agrotis ipsilon multiple nucleopolyhedrovirus]